MLERTLADGGQANISFERTNVFFRQFSATDRTPIWNINTEVERINKVVMQSLIVVK